MTLQLVLIIGSPGSPAHLAQDELCASQSSSVHARGHPEDTLIDELSPTITGEPEYCAGPWPKEVVFVLPHQR